MMNFRQRMGWVGVALYLLLSILATYYIFEVHSLSVERVQRGGISSLALPPAVSAHLPPAVSAHLPPAVSAHLPPAVSAHLPPAVSAHLPALTLWMWAGLFLLPYLQIFLFLFSCTRADPRAVGYCALPVCIVLLCSRRHAAKSANHRAGLLIDT